MKDLHGQAILDYYKKEPHSPLLLHNSYGEPEEMPVEVFFREHEDFTELENTAISECSGTVLDLGAAAGAHALFLQALEFDVTALDNSPGCIDCLQMSGMKKYVNQDYRKHKGQYDTVLLLMNGLGIAGTLDEVPNLLKQCKKMLNKGGQILLDSSDISYLYEEDIQKPEGYFGEVRYQYEYKNQRGDWFDWVYVDQNKLKEITDSIGLKLEIIFTDENDQYLARIT